MRKFLFSMFAIFGLAACGGGGSNSTEEEPVPPGVEANAPAANLAVEIGQPVEIRYVDDGAGGETDVVAVRESDGMEIVVAADRPHQDAVEQTVVWNTGGVPAGTWRIEFRSTRDGESATTTAPGKVTLSEPAGGGPGGPLGGSSDSEVAYGAAAFADGDYAAGGIFVNTMDFPGGLSLVSAGDNAAFVARYAADGTFRWARSIDGERSGRLNDVAALSDGSVVAVGYHSNTPDGGTIVFSPGRPDSVSIDTPPTPQVNAAHAYVARFDADGGLAWATVIESDFSVFAEGAAPAPSTSGPDGVLVVGTYRERAVFAPGTPNETVLTLSGNQTMYFIARYEHDGSLSWVRTGQHPSGFGFTDGLDVDSFPDGSFVMGGKRGNALVLGPGEPNATTLSGSAAFLARFDADGRLQWARDAGTTSHTHARSVAAGDLGVSFLHFLVEGGTVSYPGSPPVMVDAGGDVRSVLVAFDAMGNAMWAKLVGGSTYWWHSLAANEASVFMTGSLNGDEVFGEGEPGETTLSALNGHNTFFVARYNPGDGTLGWARQTLASTDHNVGHAVTDRPGGGAVVAGYFYGTMTVPAESGDLELESMGLEDFFIFPVSDVD